MSHTCTPDESNTLHYLAQALRPDWKPNRPGQAWQRRLGMKRGDLMTLTHADDFHHALRALTHYATAHATDGSHLKRTPDYFLEPGRHWTETQRVDETAQPPCDQHGTDYGTKRACRACRSEIVTGDRPEDMMGEYYEPSNPAVGQPFEEPEERNTVSPVSQNAPQTPQNDAQEAK